MRVGRVIGAALLAVVCTAPGPAAGAAGDVRCRPTRSHTVVPGFMPVVGAGPAYGAAQLSRNPVVFGPPGDTWGGAKVLWIGDPGYDGTVVIRGRRIDAPGPVRFDSGFAERRFQSRLRLSSDEYAHGSWAGSAAGWRDWPSAVRVKKSGCYELTVRTREGVDRIVFRAQRLTGQPATIRR